MCIKNYYTKYGALLSPEAPYGIKAASKWAIAIECAYLTMKLTVLFLSLLSLTLLHEAVSTHLQTCECHEVRELVNITVQEAVAGLEDRLTRLLNINTTDSSTLETRLTTTMKQLIDPIKQQLDYHLPPPSPLGTKYKPANSCKDLHKTNPKASSGYYWIKQSSGSPARVYCSMSGTCGNETRGWMRVANIDMRNTSQSCPSGLSLISSPKRVCDIPSNGCVSNTFSVQGLQYNKVCGKIIAYQKITSIAFAHGSRGIDRDYVYGVSLTHGQNPRKHIWTFAGASDETNRHYDFKCPCINTALTLSRVPSFVGNDYFCDTALSGSYTGSNEVYTYDPLWDGKGCGSTNRCCSFNTPPWFVKNLSSSTTDNIEMRMCRPDGSGTTPYETVELYVQWFIHVWLM